MRWSNHPFLTGIPDHLLAVLDEIEVVTGIRPSIREMDDELREGLPGMREAAAVADIHPAARSITIWVDLEQLASHVLAHEIMHLRRDVLESVPKVMSHVNHAGDCMFESELEHLFIIPEEIQEFPEAEEWWRMKFREVIDGTEDVVTLFCTYPLVCITLPNHPDLAADCLTRLEKLGAGRHRETVVGHCEALMEALPDKHKVLEVWWNRWRPKVREQFFVGRYDPSLRVIPVELSPA